MYTNPLNGRKIHTSGVEIDTRLASRVELATLCRGVDGNPSAAFLAGIEFVKNNKGVENVR